MNGMLPAANDPASIAAARSRPRPGTAVTTVPYPLRVRVITDSAGALDPRTAAGHGVRVVPMTTQAGGRTSAPSPGRFLAAISEPPTPDGVVIVTVAANLSASHRAAALAARLSAASGGPPAEVVDSGSAAGGQALVTLAAARAAADGLSAETAAGVARQAAADVRVVGMIGSLEALARGGRLPRTAAAAGRLFTGVQPLFELRNGRVRALRPALSRPAALDRLAAAFWRDGRPGAVAEIAISHAGAAPEAEELLAMVTRDIAPAMVTVGGLGAAMLAHAGRGTLGLSWRWRSSP